MTKKSYRDISLEYDQQFKEALKTAKFLVKHLNDTKEQLLANKWLSRVSTIKSSILNVKKCRNAFLSYLIKVLKNEVRRECLEFLDTNEINFEDGFSEISIKGDENSKCRSEIQFHSKWSQDQRTYVAVQLIPGQGALVYMAASKKPGITNWDLPSSKNN